MGYFRVYYSLHATGDVLIEAESKEEARSIFADAFDDEYIDGIEYGSVNVLTNAVVEETEEY